MIARLFSIFLILVQKQVSATPLKDHILKKSKGQNIKIDFFGKRFSLQYCLYSIMLAKSFWYFFNFQKRVLFPKKYCLALIVENRFLEFHTGIQFYLMCLILKVLTFHLKCPNFWVFLNLLNNTIISNCDVSKYFYLRD